MLKYCYDNEKQKQIIFTDAEGKCQRCSCELEQGKLNHQNLAIRLHIILPDQKEQIKEYYS